ncbi:MAG: class I SAM-dependent methyltransferase, partial [Methanomassiliicoccales archaeon]|nr:class I SAM-dependent methyltransferase [Methanomassiliicoccales archaeon]
SIETIKCDIETDTACFHGRKFDYILFMDVLEHLRSPIRGLENIRELLKENGTLFIHTPNACSIPTFYSLLRNREKVSNYMDPRTVSDLHLQLYDFFTLTKLCNFVGLKVTRIIPTTATIPNIISSRIVARFFPGICNTLLIECNKCQPIDIAKVVDSWLSSSSTKKE